MREVAIYVNNTRLDLFKDEVINVKSRVQDIANISKVFTDSTPSFNIPASPKNNEVFNYYYENALTGFNANELIEAYIEIDSVLFRTGNVRLQDAKEVNGQPESYTIQFLGVLTSLKTRFGTDKLKDLDYSSIPFFYDGPNVKSSIVSTAQLDLRFPLISSSSYWQSGDTINFSELFPAISDAKILELIESEYGVTFSGGWKSDPRFINSFTWYKSKLETAFSTIGDIVPINTSDTLLDSNLYWNPLGGDEMNIQYLDFNTVNTAPLLNFISWDHQRHTALISVVPSVVPASGTGYYLDVYKNGNLHNTTFQSATGGSSFPTLFFVANDVVTTQGINDVYTFRVRAKEQGWEFTCDTLYNSTLYYVIPDQANPALTDIEQVSFEVTQNAYIVGSGELSLADNAPDITVSDWFSGTLKQFNLTCVPIDNSDTEYILETVPDWYDEGEDIDITDYVDEKSIKYERPKLYKSINFEYAKSRAILNSAFSDLNNREWASLREDFPNYDGGKFEVKLPFENLLFTNIANTPLTGVVAYAIDSDLKPYVPKCVKLQLNGQSSCGLTFNDGVTSTVLNTYMPFGDLSEFASSYFTNNFGAEISAQTLDIETHSLYDAHYKPYLQNLYNEQTRKVSCSAQLPVNILTNLKLNDRLVIREKQYRINDMKTNLSSGEVKLVLLNDMKFEKVANIKPNLDGGGGLISIPYKPTKPGYTVLIEGPTQSPVFTTNPTLPHTDTAAGVLEITMPPNNSGKEIYHTYTVKLLKPDGSVASEKSYLLQQSPQESNIATEQNFDLLTEDLKLIIIE